MSRRSPVLFAALLALCAQPTAASASQGFVHVVLSVTSWQFGGGWVVEVDCYAVAVPTVSIVTLEPPHVPTAASVRCSVNNVSAATALPGAAAANAVVSLVAGPFTVCAHGTATFLDAPNGAVYTVTAEKCESHPR